MRAVLPQPVQWLWSAVLTTAALLGAVCLLATLVAPLLGIRPLIFLSGSMSPTIPAGSLAIAETVQAADLEVGDIVTVTHNGAYVTHRVVAVTHSTGKATLTLRGDGNDVADSTVHEVTSAPRTRIWAPGLGSAVAWFSHAPGVYVLAGWVAIVFASLRRDRSGSPRGPVPPAPRTGPPKALMALTRRTGLRLGHPERGLRLARGAAAAAAMVAAPLAAPSPAMAAWADTAQTTGTTIGTVTPTAPVASCGAVSGSSITVTWTAAPGAIGYQITYGGLGNPTTINVDPAPRTRTFNAPASGAFKVRTLYGGTWISGLSNELRYDTSGQGSCTNFG